MTDAFGREIKYMRVSVTDRCNMRCLYCMPESGIEQKKHGQILRSEEIIEIVSAAAQLGITKIRITGGEPLVRQGIVELCGNIAKIDGITDVAVTTNGQSLGHMANALRQAGVKRINMSIDTLDADKYRKITRIGDLNLALAGLEASKKAGFEQIKLNVVLMSGFNDDEIIRFAEMTRTEDIEVRFIELMPVGESVSYWHEKYMPNTVVLNCVPELEPHGSDGVAKLYALPDSVGRIGLISPISSHFCSGCDKIRLTADGKIKPCLHSDVEIDARGIHVGELECVLKTAIESKPKKHNAHSGHSRTGRAMNSIGG